MSQPTLADALRRTWVWWLPPLVVLGLVLVPLILQVAGVTEASWAYAIF